MTDPVSLITAAKLLEMALSAGIGLGVSSLAGGVSKALKDANDHLQADTERRVAHMVAIVQEAAVEMQPVLEQIRLETGQDHSEFFQHPPFLVQTVQTLLLGGRPDLNRLKQDYQARYPDDRWPQLQAPLYTFVKKIESKLLADTTVWGPVLSAFQIEAQVAGLNETSLHIAALVEQMIPAVKDLPDAVVKRLHPLDLEVLEKAYLLQVARQCNRLSLAGDAIDPVAQGLPRLQRVYVDLDTDRWPTMSRIANRLQLSLETTAQMKQLLQRWATKGMPEQAWDGRLSLDLIQHLTQDLRERSAGSESDLGRQLDAIGIQPEKLSTAMQRISVLEAIADTKHKQLVLLGDPGSGKSTLTQRLAGMLASLAHQDLLPEDRDWQAHLEGIFGRWLLPVRIVLNRWADQLPNDAEGTPGDLIAECLRVIRQAVGDVADERLKERFVGRLTAGSPSVLVLLDGLDEVTEEKKRKRLLKSIHSFCEGYRNVPLIITCRVLPYKHGETYRLPLDDITLGRLSDESIERFIKRWHDDLIDAQIADEKTARNKQEQLRQAVWNPGQSELHDMAGNPLLLTMMAIVNREGGLPDTRAELYERCARQLLYEWEKLKQSDSGRKTDLITLLDSAGIKQGNLDSALDKLAFDKHGTQGGRDTVKIPDADLCAQLKQLYLDFHPREEAEAAAWAVNVRTLIDERSGLINAKEKGKVYEFAHRTFQEYLAARHMANDIGRFQERINDVNWQEVVLLALGYQIYCQKNANTSVLTLTALLRPPLVAEQDRRRVLLVGEGYVHLLKPGGARQSSLNELVDDLQINVPKKLTLAMQTPPLDDEARKRGPQIARQRLDAGLLLADLNPETPAMDDFVSIPDAGFAIGRYPVTNREFKRFMDSGGYNQDKPWWSEKARQELPQYSGSWPTGPRYLDESRFNHPTQPVVGVSWYEANAYCAWLTGELQSEGQDVEVRLPTLEEWQQAAGPERYPWGKEFDPACANTEESGLGQTTPVDMYPLGATAGSEEERVWDMAGNVWEWTRTRDESLSFEAYVLAGGAWWNDASRVGSAARLRYHPGDWTDLYGFRVLAVPISRSGSF